jgi:hypothetical protein
MKRPARLSRLALPGLLTLWHCAALAAPLVVLNEVQYHPPDDHDELQYVELYNAGDAEADLGGWVLKGAKFTFPAGAKLAAGAYTVVARDPAALVAHFGADTPVAGAFEGRLKHGGEKLELLDAAGKTADAVKFSDRAPWPAGPDGHSASLERICPAAPGELPHNWAGSELPEFERTAGTPGRRNDSFFPHLPPQITEAGADTAQPGRPLTVRCRVADPRGVVRVVVAHVLPDVAMPAEQEVELKRVSGDARDGRYEGQLPAVPEGALRRYRFRAEAADAVVRWLPDAKEPRPTFTAAGWANTNTAQVPFFYLRQLGPTENRGSSLRSRPRRGQLETEPTAGNAALVVAMPGAKAVELYDHIRLTPRQGGWKVRFLKDRPWREMPTLNLIFEQEPRFVLAEHLAYELFRQAGVAAPASGHARVWSDGNPLGYHLYVEQPNRAFLRRHGYDPDGNLYKLLWYGQGLVGQHEKKTNPRTGHQDLKDVVAKLEGATGAAQWEVIRRQFNLTNFAGYYAVNMCVQNWDGFFNNYFLHHDLGPEGRWSIIPWDEDKTWGYFDGGPRDASWYDMPLTLGMRGDKPGPVSARRGVFALLGGGGMQGPFGGPGWWRPGGWFAEPLLANEEFRKRFLARLRELCDGPFTEAQFGPVIDGLQNRLLGEVTFRADALGYDPEAAVREFRTQIESFRRQVVKRREFILQQLGK